MESESPLIKNKGFDWKLFWRSSIDFIHHPHTLFTNIESWVTGQLWNFLVFLIRSRHIY